MLGKNGISNKKKRTTNYKKKLIGLPSCVPKSKNKCSRRGSLRLTSNTIKLTFIACRVTGKDGRLKSRSSVHMNSKRCIDYSMNVSTINSSGLRCYIKKSSIGKGSIKNSRLSCRLYTNNRSKKMIARCFKNQCTELLRQDTVKNNSLNTKKQSMKINNIIRKSRSIEN